MKDFLCILRMLIGAGDFGKISIRLFICRAQKCIIITSAVAENLASLTQSSINIREYTFLVQLNTF
jgi:hypothetical protein